MKKITAGDLNKLNVGSKNKVTEELRKLDIGEILQVEHSDWNLKTSIGVMVASTFRDGRKFRTKTIKDGGWVITRIS